MKQKRIKIGTLILAVLLVFVCASCRQAADEASASLDQAPEQNSTQAPVENAPAAAPTPTDSPEDGPEYNEYDSDKDNDGEFVIDPGTIDVDPDGIPIPDGALDFETPTTDEGADNYDTGEEFEEIEVETTTIYVPDPEEIPEDIPDEFREHLENLGKIESIIPNVGNENNNNNVTTDPAPSQEPEEPVVERITRTDEDVMRVATEFANNFKNTETYANLTGVAAQYADVNIETIRTNPESDETLNRAIESYKQGRFSEEDLIYDFEMWVRIAGPYGGQTITVQ